MLQSDDLFDIYNVCSKICIASVLDCICTNTVSSNDCQGLLIQVLPSIRSWIPLVWSVSCSQSAVRNYMNRCTITVVSSIHLSSISTVKIRDKTWSSSPISLRNNCKARFTCEPCPKPPLSISPPTVLTHRSARVRTYGDDASPCRSTKPSEQRIKKTSPAPFCRRSRRIL